MQTSSSAQGFLLFFLLLPRDTGSPRHSCNKIQINKTELRSCGVSSFKVVRAVPADPRSSRAPPPEPLPRPGRRTRPCKTSSGSRFAFDLSPRTSLIWDSLTVTDSPDMRPLVFREGPLDLYGAGKIHSLRSGITSQEVLFTTGWMAEECCTLFIYKALQARVSCLPNYHSDSCCSGSRDY